MSSSAATAPARAAQDLNSRYAGQVPDGVLHNPVVDGLLAHRSVRAFQDRALPAGTLETMVAAAHSAATSSNLQTWSVIAVRDPARKAALAELANNQKFINRAPLFLCWLADLSRLERVGQRAGVAMEGISYLEMFMVAALDAALAAQNAVVAAESLGLSTCYIGALRSKPLEVASVLKLPPNVLAVFGLCVGYEDPAAVTEVKPRLPQSVVLHHETYDAAPEDVAVPAYDQAMLDFSRRNGMGEADWSKRALGRAGPITGMSGRHRMTEYLRTLGFGLK